jgi:ABC-type glutathione transport system ATPase component
LRIPQHRPFGNCVIITAFLILAIIGLANLMSATPVSNIADDSADRLLLSARGLCVRADNRLLLDRIDLDLHEGEIVTVIGPNGAGKTTLLKTLLGFTAPSAGSVTRTDTLRIGYMPQKLSLNPLLPMTVQRFLRQTKTSDAAIISALTETGVDNLLQQSLHKISGGELQRVLLARALLRKPQLLVLDEPAQGVDVCGQADLVSPDCRFAQSLSLRRFAGIARFAFSDGSDRYRYLSQPTHLLPRASGTREPAS